MANSWRTRKSGSSAKSVEKSSAAEKADLSELVVPAPFRCPISLELMTDPVTVSTGISYDRRSIEAWLDMGNRTCPVTNQRLQEEEEEEIIPNHSIRRMIQDWCVENRAYGVERIPTPRIPMTSMQAAEILSEVSSANCRGDGDWCRELAAKIKALAKESERNRRCLMAAGAGRALAASFDLFAGSSLDSSRTRVVQEEILSTLPRLFPLDEEASRYISTPESLAAIVSTSISGDLAGRLNAVLLLKELVSSDKERAAAIAETKGLSHSLVKLIKEPISPQATKASLVTTFFLVSSGEQTAAKFVEAGVLPFLLDILVDSEKSMAEKALAVLDGIFGCRRGREEAYNHALTMPVLAKKMFRVSDMATEFAVSAIWRLCKNDDTKEEEECIMEALRVGAFQKLLLLLQVGCRETVKEKVTELLKVMNGFRGRVECIETQDFRGLKRPS